MKKLLLLLLFFGLHSSLMCGTKQRNTEFFSLFKQSLVRYYSVSAVAFVYQHTINSTPRIFHCPWPVYIFWPFAVSVAITPFLHAYYNENFMQDAIKRDEQDNSFFSDFKKID